LKIPENFAAQGAPEVSTTPTPVANRKNLQSEGFKYFFYTLLK
jgi:hypothetical protein